MTVSPGFLEVLAAEALLGRGFEEADDAGGPLVALVDESLARIAFPGGRAVGARIRVAGDSLYRTVVGVVPDLTPQGLGAGTEPGGLYLPLAQNMPASLSILARHRTGIPSDAIPTLLRAVEVIDPTLPVDRVASLSARIDEGVWLFKAIGSIFAFFGAAAVLMAGIGLYGVLAFTIARRRWELGLRAALGARSAHLVSLVSGQAARQLGIGLAMGLALGWLASIPLTGVSFGSQPRDPWILVWVAGVVALVGAAATLTPARRALLANPAAIMRGT
jgi:hypothetical protein